MSRTAWLITSALLSLVGLVACISGHTPDGADRLASSCGASPSTATVPGEISELHLEFRSWAFEDSLNVARIPHTLHVGDRIIQIPFAVRAFDICAEKNIAIVTVGRKGAMFKGSHDPEDEDVLLIDLRSGMILTRDRSHWWPPDEVQISPNGQLVAIGCSFGSWPTGTGEKSTWRDVGTLRLSLWTTSDLKRVSEVRWSVGRQRHTLEARNGFSQFETRPPTRVNVQPSAPTGIRAPTMVESSGRSDREHVGPTRGLRGGGFATQRIIWSPDSRFVVLHVLEAFTAIYDVVTRLHDEIQSPLGAAVEVVTFDKQRMILVCADGTEIEWISPVQGQDITTAHSRRRSNVHSAAVLTKLRSAWLENNHALGESLRIDNAWYDDRGVVQYDPVQRQLRRFQIPEAATLRDSAIQVVVSPDQTMIALVTRQAIRVFTEDGVEIQERCVRLSRKDSIEHVRWVSWTGGATLAYVVGPLSSPF